VIEPGLIDGLDGFLIGLVTQVDAADFSADVFRQRDDVEAVFMDLLRRLARSCQNGYFAAMA